MLVAAFSETTRVYTVSLQDVCEDLYLEIPLLKFQTIGVFSGMLGTK